MNSDYSAAGVLCRWFELDLRAIQSLQLPNGADESPALLTDFKKALVVTLVDGLAKLRYPSTDGNKERFTSFLREHGGWPDSDLVSVPVLDLRLSKRGAGKRLRARLADRLSEASGGANTTLPISVLDLPLDELTDLASGKEELNLIESSRHFNLFYAYRNYLLHERRPPGFGLEGSLAEGQPSYEWQANADKWSLAYPERFFFKLAQNGIESFWAYLTSKGIDPYAKLANSDAWER